MGNGGPPQGFSMICSHYCVQIASYTHFRNMLGTMLLMGHARMAMCDHHPQQSAIIIGLYEASCSTCSNSTQTRV
jgi:hypothetical protein